MPRHHYFGFGMNMREELMPARSTLIGPAMIAGWRYDFRHFADVQRAGEDEYTLGLVWEIDDAGLAYLDQREGYHGPGRENLYDRVEWKYELLNTGHTGYAIVYTMRHPWDLSLPDASYLSIIQKANVRHGIPDEPLRAALDRAALVSA